MYKTNVNFDWILLLIVSLNYFFDMKWMQRLTNLTSSRMIETYCDSWTTGTFILPVILFSKNHYASYCTPVITYFIMLRYKALNDATGWNFYNQNWIACAVCHFFLINVIQKTTESILKNRIIMIRNKTLCLMLFWNVFYLLTFCTPQILSTHIVTKQINKKANERM